MTRDCASCARREPVDQQFAAILDGREAAGHIAVQRRVADRHLALVAGGQQHAPGLVRDAHQQHAAAARLDVLLRGVRRRPANSSLSAASVASNMPSIGYLAVLHVRASGPAARRRPCSSARYSARAWPPNARVRRPARRPRCTASAPSRRRPRGRAPRRESGACRRSRACPAPVRRRRSPPRPARARRRPGTGTTGPPGPLFRSTVQALGEGRRAQRRPRRRHPSRRNCRRTPARPARRSD
jgi:hypothetical protein